MTEYEIVIAKSPPGDFTAYVASRPDIWGCGKSIVGAIENLLSYHKEKLNALADDETYQLEYPTR